MSLTFVIASVFLAICFTLEYFFTKKRPFSDYFMIFFLVITGMLIQKVYGEESVQDYYPNVLMVEEDFFVENEANFEISASTYVFPPKTFDKSTMNSDYTINAKGRAAIERLGSKEARIELNRHILAADMWASRMVDCSYIPNHPEQETIVKMFITSAIAAKANPSVTVWLIFVEFSTYYAFQVVDTYYDIEACSKAVTWHESCAQAFLEYCARKKY